MRLGQLAGTHVQTLGKPRVGLQRRGIGAGDTVAAMLPNTPPMYEAHFGVPVTGAVLNTLNTRLDAEAIAFMLQHGEAKVLLTDREFAPVIGKALAMMSLTVWLRYFVERPRSPRAEQPYPRTASSAGARSGRATGRFMPSWRQHPAAPP